MFQNLHKQEKGQGLVEYALILVLVAIVVIAILLVVGPAVSNVFCEVSNKLQKGSCSVGSGDIISANTTYSAGSGPLATPSITINVTVESNVTSVKLSGDATSGNTPCNSGSCVISVENSSLSSPGSGTVTVHAGGTGSISVSW